MLKASFCVQQTRLCHFFLSFYYFYIYFVQCDFFLTMFVREKTNVWTYDVKQFVNNMEQPATSSIKNNNKEITWNFTTHLEIWHGFSKLWADTKLIHCWKNLKKNWSQKKNRTQKNGKLYSNYENNAKNLMEENSSCLLFSHAEKLEKFARFFTCVESSFLPCDLAHS